ncbi:MAG: hypothetical protein RI897_4020 [Verrucomicrobiota bacterium]
MGGIDGLAGALSGLEQSAEAIPEAISSVGEGEDADGIGGAGFFPTGGDGFGCLEGGEGAFEFIGDDEDFEWAGGGVWHGVLGLGERGWGSNKKPKWGEWSGLRAGFTVAS